MFSSNKNAKELGIKTSEKFVVMEIDGDDENYFSVGDVLILKEDNDTPCPVFTNISKDNLEVIANWSQLSYLCDCDDCKEHIYNLHIKNAGILVTDENYNDVGLIVEGSYLVFGESAIKILGVCGGVAFVSKVFSYDSANRNAFALKEFANKDFYVFKDYDFVKKLEEKSKVKEDKSKGSDILDDVINTLEKIINKLDK
jgi:hypothetical protein